MMSKLSIIEALKKTLQYNKEYVDSLNEKKSDIGHNHDDAYLKITDAIKVEKSNINGNIIINGEEVKVFDESLLQNSINKLSTGIDEINTLLGDDTSE